MTDTTKAGSLHEPGHPARLEMVAAAMRELDLRNNPEYPCRRLGEVAYFLSGITGLRDPFIHVLEVADAMSVLGLKHSEPMFYYDCEYHDGEDTVATYIYRERMEDIRRRRENTPSRKILDEQREDFFGVTLPRLLREEREKRQATEQQD